MNAAPEVATPSAWPRRRRRHVVAAVLSLALAVPVLIEPIALHPAVAGSMLLLGGGGGRAPSGFLSNCAGQFSPTNYAINSNDFTTGSGWTASGSVAAAPTIANVSDTLPDGTTGTVSRAVFGATTTGTAQFSVLSYANTSLLGPYAISFPIWAKVTSGTGTLFTSISRSTTFFNASITNDGQWHEIIPATTGNVFGNNNVTLQIGLNQFDPAQRTPTASITVELTGAALVGTQYASVIPYSAVKIGGPLATVGTSGLVGTFTVPCPPHVAFRDPAKIVPYVSNPIVSEAGEPWRDGGVSNPYIQAQFQSGGFYWAFANCTSSATHNDWMSFCLFKSPVTDGLNWTEDTTNAPYLQTFGSILAKPTISAAGSGFTAGSGTATWTGPGCGPNPLLAVTVAVTTISAVTPSPNNGVGTGACPSPAGTWPTGAGTTWSYSGVGAGSGASFTFASVRGTGSGPSWWQLHPAFLPYGCNDGTNPHTFCVIYGAQTSGNVGFLYVAWASTVNGVYTPLGCAGPGVCTGATPISQLNQPTTGLSNVQVPTVFNVGGSTGTNYIITTSGSTAQSGNQFNVWTTPANPATTTSGNTLTYVYNAGFTLTSGVDWYSPNTASNLIDPYIFQNHCGFYELYYTVLNTTSSAAPFTNSKQQIVAEAVSTSPAGPWYQNPEPFIPTSSSMYGGAVFFGDSAAVEIGGQFIYTSNNDDASNTSRAMAATGPQGNCP
jgi:hypothetical protein